MDFESDRKKLTAAMARVVHAQRELTAKRRALQKHASGMLDHRIHAIEVASSSLEREDNPLVARYLEVQHHEAAQLRGVALREEARRGAEHDERDRSGRG